MEHIDVDARYFKKQYDEIGEPPKPGDNWWLDNNTGVATVAAVEPLRADIYNFSESYVIYPSYFIAGLEGLLLLNGPVLPFLLSWTLFLYIFVLLPVMSAVEASVQV